MQEPIVDIYCRVATAGIDVASLDKQEAACRAYCLEHGLTVGTVFHEIAPGSKYRNRESLALLRARYKAGAIQGVVITNLDRLSRNQVHLVILMSEMEQYKVTLYAVKESIDQTALGKLVRILMVFVADVEREKALES